MLVFDIAGAKLVSAVFTLRNTGQVFDAINAAFTAAAREGQLADRLRKLPALLASKVHAPTRSIASHP